METNQYVLENSRKANQVLQHFFHQPMNRQINTKKTQLAVWNKRVSHESAPVGTLNSTCSTLTGSAFSPSFSELSWFCPVPKRRWCNFTVSPAAPSKVTHQICQPDPETCGDRPQRCHIPSNRPQTTWHWGPRMIPGTIPACQNLWCIVSHLIEHKTKKQWLAGSAPQQTGTALLREQWWS